MSSTAQRNAMREASRPLAESLMLKPGDTFPASSGSKDGDYPMLVLPEGQIVHTDEGCWGEFFRGPGSCHHSKDSERYVMTTALARYEETMSPVAINFNDEQMAVIKQTIAKGATDTELQLFVATCKRTGLDPFLKQIYAVKRYDSREKKEVMAIQIGIDGLRLTADRSGKYAGQDPVEWLDVNGQWSEVWTGAGDHPVAARASVYRKDFAVPVKAVARWDSYAQTYGADKKLSPTWASMPDVMIGKCAEALALRRAFPAELSGLAAVMETEYDPAADAQELAQAAYDPEPVVMITDAQRKRLVALWDPKAPAATTLRQRFPQVFPQPSPGASNRISDLTADEADEVITILEAKQEAATTATSGPEAELPDAASPAASPDHSHDYKWNDDKALIACVECGDPDPAQFELPLEITNDEGATG